MPSIRYRHNQGNVVLNGDGNASTVCVTKNNLPALLANGDLWYMPFRGFMSWGSFDPKRQQLIKLVDLVAFTLDDDGLAGWQDIHKNSYCVGCSFAGGYYLFLDDSFPVTRDLPPRKRQSRDNVTPLHPS